MRYVLIIGVLMGAIHGCNTVPDPRDEIRPPRFEPCEIVITDDHGNSRCSSRERLCRELVNCE